ncbi:hypothetical protein [Streptomyces sp. NPDC059802]|uniref:hypothetical protein n=1 Tax=Streptomyces sp. NPDC059802 TaxID=3346952 RepID=UPI003655A5BC
MEPAAARGRRAARRAQRTALIRMTMDIYTFARLDSQRFRFRLRRDVLTGGGKAADADDGTGFLVAV